jgi:hypothetical protein
MKDVKATIVVHGECVVCHFHMGVKPMHLNGDGTTSMKCPRCGGDVREFPIKAENI